MYENNDCNAEGEPPSSPVSDDAELVDRVMAIAHLPPTAHVAVIGHHTLPFVLGLLRRGCDCVRSLRPGAPAPDCEAADLAWIVDVDSEHELDDALRAARWRAGAHGRVVLEGAACRWRSGLAAVRDHAVAAGLDIVSFDHVARRLVLAHATAASRGRKTMSKFIERCHGASAALPTLPWARSTSRPWASATA
jgi:hypothetical protein